ncbi:MAG: response regulator [Acidobacteriota bacterium]
MKPRRVFLVEDNEADANLVREVFRFLSMPCEISHYTTVQEGVAAAAREGQGDRAIPDLILVDHNLPGGDGLEVLAAIAMNPHLREVPKAILSSFVLPEEMKRAERLGTHCVISKPASLHEFLNEVGSEISSLLNYTRASAAGGERPS